MTSLMVLLSHIRESRTSAKKPQPESRTEVVTRPEMELTAEVVAAPIFVRGVWGH